MNIGKRSYFFGLSVVIFSASNTFGAPIAVTAGPQQILTKQCAGPYTIKRPGTRKVTRSISGYLSAKLFSDPECKQELLNGNKISFATGMRSATFYIRDGLAENLSLSIMNSPSSGYSVRVLLSQPSPTPVPTATPRPTASPVPTATPTPRPSVTPVPTATPRPTASPVPTATPTPMPTGSSCAPEPANFYASPSGNDSNPGTLQQPFKTLAKLLSSLSAGQLGYIRGGTYAQSTQLYINLSGSAGGMIRIWAYPCETPVITKTANYSGNDLIEFSGQYVHFKGLEITSTPQQSGQVAYPSFRSENSLNCIYEQIHYHHNPAGFALRGNSNGNLVLNSDFHHNADPYGWMGNGQDAYDGADGINITFISNGNANNNVVNTIRGCRAWYNADDGFDGWENWGHLVIENSWSFHNGYREGTFNTAGNGTGFKLGAYSGGVSTKLIRTLTNNIAFQNRLFGFNENNGVGKHILYNNTAVQHGYHNYWFGAWGASSGTFRNNVSYNAGVDPYQTMPAGATVDHNSWQLSRGLLDSDFQSLDSTQLYAPRKPDGSLPDLPTFLRPSINSILRDTGIGVGLPYNGVAPDIGALEY